MAFLVCYSTNPPHDHPGKKAIYLEQEFYALIVDRCLAPNAGFAVLSQIAALKDKSPTPPIQSEEIPGLKEDLDHLAHSADHPQIQELKTVCETALTRDCALTVSGDMYPELT